MNEKLPVNWFRTGAGGGQLKPSTGYSFVRSLTDAQHLVGSIRLKVSKFKRRKSPARFAYYDRLLLKILAQKPHKGKEIFTKLFRHNEASKVLNFLDEQTTPLQEIRLMSTLPILLFVKAALNDLLAKAYILFKKRSIALFITMACLLLQQFHLEVLINALLLVGLLALT
jgi:lycopene beta-cyclase